MSDHHVRAEQDRLGELRRLRAEPKFGPEPTLFYPGAPTEQIRIECEGHLNLLLDRLINCLPVEAQKDTVMRAFRETLPKFDLQDSEERNRLGAYCERIMDILGIESSDGLLNQWRYGFDPGAVPPDV